MTNGSRRAVYAQVNSGGSFGASSLEQHMGLGQADRVLSMEVFWPTSGIRQSFDDLPLDTRIEVREGEKQYEVPQDPPDKARRTQLTVHRRPLGLRDYRRIILPGSPEGITFGEGSGGCALRSNLLHDTGGCTYLVVRRACPDPPQTDEGLTSN